MSNVSTADLVEGRFVEQEHQRLRVGLAMLEEAIGDAHRMGRPELAERLHRLMEWIDRDVLPHAAWEDAWLYPDLDRDAGTPWATRVLRFEHSQISASAERLQADAELLRGHWTSEIAYRIVADLARLQALLAAHVVQEERFVLPLLEQQRRLVRTS
ncbi:MAG TPA: hemerythrin domain-containing protein [Candidatus Limnocylindrales bacterium]|nr:hemerythrin domain-containing protein [Candidatus Limnocylindrales bacterium]